MFFPMETCMAHAWRARVTLLLSIIAAVWMGAASTGHGAASPGQAVKPVNDLPNPWRTIDNWGEGPAGRKFGAVSDIAIDRDGRSVWVLERCGEDTCVGPGKDELDTIFLFDSSGKRVRSFGKGM